MLIADFHIHSKYSRATSKDMDILSLFKWGKIKGINVIGTGDFTHPLWLNELKTYLEPAENGLFKLKKEYENEINNQIPKSVRNNILRFILTVEISNIYSKNGKVRKLHNVMVVPSFKNATNINQELDKIGNLKADGRPILGMDSKDLLKLTLDIDSKNLFFPAHIWTPWFSMFGSKSGFNSIEETFEELSSEIKVVETGLSSDPFMNWRLKQLENITLISNSDAHSARKLGREANLLNCKLDYEDIIKALKTNDKRMVGTIEFYPQEGKYHYDGHRSCNIRFSPTESKKYNNICPKCNKPLVLGVDYRVSELADFDESYRPQPHKKVEYIVPLAEIIAQTKGIKSTTSKTVEMIYFDMISKLSNEFDILRNLDIEQIKNAGFRDIAIGIENMRSGNVYIEPGYDGVYGIIKVFDPQKDKNSITGQRKLL